MTNLSASPTKNHLGRDGEKLQMFDDCLFAFGTDNIFNALLSRYYYFLKGKHQNLELNVTEMFSYFVWPHHEF